MVTGDVFTNESYGIMVCNKNTDLVAKINKALAELKADGTISKLEQKWLAAAQ
jgi:ABC-type amino acid transport substrate-binding protein